MNYEVVKAALQNFHKYSELLPFSFINKPVLYQGKPFTGIVYSKLKWQQEGKPMVFDMNEKYIFEEGMLEGKFLATLGSYPYYSQGGGKLYTVQIKGPFKHGTLDGLFEKYMTINVLIEKGSYKNGQQEGIWKYYLKDGTLYKYFKSELKSNHTIKLCGSVCF